MNDRNEANQYYSKMKPPFIFYIKSEIGPVEFKHIPIDGCKRFQDLLEYPEEIRNVINMHFQKWYST